MPEKIDTPGKTQRFLPRAAAVIILLFSLFSIQGARSELAKLELQTRSAIELLLVMGQHNWGIYAEGSPKMGLSAKGPTCVGFLTTDFSVVQTATFHVQGEMQAKLFKAPELLKMEFKADFANYLQLEKINGQAAMKSGEIAVASRMGELEKIDLKFTTPDLSYSLEAPLPKPVFLVESVPGIYALRLPKGLEGLTKGSKMGLSGGVQLKPLTVQEFERCKHDMNNNTLGNIPDFSELGRLYQTFIAQKKLGSLS